jgi:hypothetical protein
MREIFNDVIFQKEGFMKMHNDFTLYFRVVPSGNGWCIIAPMTRTETVCKDRKIWRHFFNSQLLNGGFSIKQTQAVTGHKSERMSELYFHFDPNEYKKAMEIQEKLLSPVPEKQGKLPQLRQIRRTGKSSFQR